MGADAGAVDIAALPSDGKPVFGWGVMFWCGLLAAAYFPILLIRWGQPRPITDFAVFWTAGRLALVGRTLAVYDWSSLRAALQIAVGYTDPRPLLYPPIALLFLAPLGLLPFAAAAAVWLTGILTVFVAGIRAVLRDGAGVFAALAAPAVLFNLTSGNSALLTAGLLAGALAILDPRPIAGGVLLGLLAYKPHFGIVLPLFLAVSGRWRVFAAAAATVVVLVALATALFGFEAFLAFARNLPTAGDSLLGDSLGSRIIDWGDLASFYGAFRVAGLGAPLAWAAHLAIAAAVVAASLRIAVASAPYQLKAAALSLAVFVATPYSQLNDTAILIVPWAFLFRDGASRGLRLWERVGLWTVYALPLLYILGLALARGIFGLLNGAAAPRQVLPVTPASWVGIGPCMCLILTALIGARLKRSAAPGRLARPARAGMLPVRRQHR